LAACFLFGCASSNATSITLYHPKTKVARTCAVRDSGGKNIEALSGVVEACAKQLESRGFVRAENLPKEAKPSYKDASIP
jgi:hypothetical protein